MDIGDSSIFNALVPGPETTYISQPSQRSHPVNIVTDLDLRSALTFYADFDDGFDALFSRGDGSATVDVDRYPPRLSDTGGRFGGAALFCYEDQQDSVWTHDLGAQPVGALAGLEESG